MRLHGIRQILIEYDVTGQAGFIALDQFGVRCGDTTFVVGGSGGYPVAPDLPPEYFDLGGIEGIDAGPDGGCIVTVGE